MSSPKKRIVPDEGGKSPVMQLNSVVLPAPFDPSTPRRSPGRTVNDTSTSAASAPKNRVTPRNSGGLGEPKAERRSATLSMTGARAAKRVADDARPLAQPSPQANEAVGR